MLYFSVALYPEAAPVIKRFSMKPAGGRLGSLYRSEDALLVLTGSGLLAASAALSEALTLFPPSSDDILINLGICGAPEGFGRQGEWFRISKITDAGTGRDFYPELLFTSPLREATLRTVAASEASPVTLTDMEAASVFQTAQAFFPPERMLFYKGISDFGIEAGGRLDAASVTESVASVLPFVLSEAETVSSLPKETASLSAETEQAVAELSKRIDASASMEHEIRLLAVYRTYRSGDAAEVIMAFCAGIPESVTRREGKKILEQFRDNCLS